MFRGGKPGERYIPGKAIPGASLKPGQAEKEDKKKRVRTKRAGKESGEANGTAATPEPPVEEMKAVEIAPEEDASAKKIRNLTKKVRRRHSGPGDVPNLQLKAIEDLKERVAKGETLEKTQLKKIETEAQVKADIAALGGSA